MNGSYLVLMCESEIFFEKDRNHGNKQRKADRQIMLDLLGRFGGLYWGGVIRLCPFSTIDPAVLYGFG